MPTFKMCSSFIILHTRLLKVFCNKHSKFLPSFLFIFPTRLLLKPDHGLSLRFHFMQFTQKDIIMDHGVISGRYVSNGNWRSYTYFGYDKTELL